MDLNLRSVCVFGGSGFVGSHIVHLLAAQGITVRVPTRYADTGKDLLVLPTVQVVEADIHERSTLQALVAGCDAVINLVGILHERGVPGGFLRVHAELPKKIVAACRSAGVGRFVHMSALDADVNGPSAYLRSKGQGEAAVKEAGGALAWTIFRPSVIFGRGDSFLNLFAQLLGVVPVVALASPDSTLSADLGGRCRTFLRRVPPERRDGGQELRPVRAEGLYAARPGEMRRRDHG